MQNFVAKRSLTEAHEPQRKILWSWMASPKAKKEDLISTKIWRKCNFWSIDIKKKESLHRDLHELCHQLQLSRTSTDPKIFKKSEIGQSAKKATCSSSLFGKDSWGWQVEGWPFYLWQWLILTEHVQQCMNSYACKKHHGLSGFKSQQEGSNIRLQQQDQEKSHQKNKIQCRKPWLLFKWSTYLYQAGVDHLMKLKPLQMSTYKKKWKRFKLMIRKIYFANRVGYLYL